MEKDPKFQILIQYIQSPNSDLLNPINLFFSVCVLLIAVALVVVFGLYPANQMEETISLHNYECRRFYCTPFLAGSKLISGPYSNLNSDSCHTAQKQNHVSHCEVATHVAWHGESGLRVIWLKSTTACGKWPQMQFPMWSSDRRIPLPCFQARTKL